MKKFSFFVITIHNFHRLHKTTKQKDKQICSTISGHKLQKAITIHIITTKFYKLHA